MSPATAHPPLLGIAPQPPSSALAIMCAVLVEAAFSRGSAQRPTGLYPSVLSESRHDAHGQPSFFTKVLSGEHDLGSQKGPAFWM